MDLEIKVKSEDDFLSIKTQVINKSGENKEIDFSFILITEQGENIISAIQRLIKDKNWEIDIKFSNDFNMLKKCVKTPLFLITLPLFLWIFIIWKIL